MVQRTPSRGLRSRVFLFLLIGLVLVAGLACPPRDARCAPGDAKPAATAQPSGDAGSASANQKEAQASPAATPEEQAKQKANEEQAKLAEARAKTEEALKAKDAEEAQQKQAQDEAAEKKRQEVAELSENDPLKDIWAGQRVMIDAVIKESTRISENFLADTGVLNQIAPIEQEIRRQLVMVNEFKAWPGMLEAVSRRLGLSVDLVQSLLLSAANSQNSARGLLEQLDNSAASMAELNMGRHGETAEYLEKINTARFLLTAVIARYTSALAPASALVDKVAATRKELADMLPELWLNYYTRPPVAWLSSSEWVSARQTMGYLGTAFSLRRAVELPLTSSQWQSAALRFVLGLVVVSGLGIVVTNSLLSGEAMRRDQVKRRCLPWMVGGLSLLAAAYTPSLEPYRLFLAMGNILLIVGLVTLAWELRRLKFPNVQVEKSPLIRIMPLTVGAYVLLYVPMPAAVALVLWLVCLAVGIWRNRRSPLPDLGEMKLESSLLDMQSLVLWPCLVLCLLGLHVYSMALYLLYSSVVLAVQISVAALTYISRLNESLDNEDSRSMLASFILALAAPMVLLLAVATVSLWLATLPGGIDLLQFYIFKSVSIGTTQLNFVQVLFIATAFFLARTAARMGKTFIAKLPTRGVRVDSSLITPMQTGYTYLVWCLFGFFALRSLGMNLSNLAVIAGGLSVGIGFGMQTIVNNFISGIILIFSRNLQVGDVVEVGNVVGRIKQINVRATVVETYDSAVIYVPNSAFVSGNLTNWTSNSRTSRQQVVVGVAYGSDTQLVTKIMLEVANKHSDVLAYPPPTVQFQDFGASTLDFRLLFWVKDYDLGNAVASQIRFAINDRFAEANIEIAYPQMDVHLKRETPPRRSSNTPVRIPLNARPGRREGRVNGRLPVVRAGSRGD